MTDSPESQADEGTLAEAVAEALEGETPVHWAPLRARFVHRAAELEALILSAERYLAARDRMRTCPTHLGPGTRLGDFEITGHLADGGMGRVYRARQHSLGGRPVALKVLPRDPDEESRRRFLREVTTLAALQHPHLVEVHGMGEHHDWLYFAMALVEGPTLRDVLSEWRQTPAADAALARRRVRCAVTWAAQVADALGALHSAGLVHRDVKPSNVMLRPCTSVATRVDIGTGGPDTSWRAVLVDLGLVRHLHEPEGTWTSAGAASQAFAPPEQLLGLPVGPSADVFTLGVTLADLILGRSPSERATAAGDPAAVVAPLQAVDERLAGLVQRATSSRAGDRHPDGVALHDELRAWLASEAPCPSSRAMGRTWSSPSPRALRHLGRPAVLCSALSVLAGLIWWFGVPGPGHPPGAEGHQRLRTAVAADGGGSPSGPRDGGRTASGEPGSEESWDAWLDQWRPDEGRLPADVVNGLAGALVRTPDGEHRRRRLQSLGRTLSERPLLDPRRQADAAPLRAAVHRLWMSAPKRERLALATVLAECGTPADVELLLAWGLASTPGAEPYRLGLQAVQRLLERAVPCGLADDVPGEAAWRDFDERVRQRLAAPDWGLLQVDSAIWAQDHALLDLVVVRALLRRITGRPAGLRALLPAEWRAALHGLGVSVGDAPLLLAASGDPTVGPYLASTLPLEAGRCAPMTPWGPWSLVWGRACGFLGDAEVSFAARRAMEQGLEQGLDEVWPSDLERFERGLAEGRSALGFAGRPRGDPPVWAGGWSGSSLPSEAWVAPPRARGDVPFSIVPFDATLPVGRPVAGWFFREQPTQLSATAGAPWGRGVWLRGDEAGGTVLVLPPGSELVLPFVIEDGPTRVRLRLRHQVSARWQLPYGGSCGLAVSIDGDRILERTVLGVSLDDMVIELDAARLPARAHELTLAIDAASQTSWWLHAAWMEIPPRPTDR